MNETRKIVCKGLRTHNLKSIDLEIPFGKWTAVTGVSGSGKSSLVFDTIYAEAQRRFLETLGTYERQFMQGLAQGDFDEIHNVPAAVALKQTNRTGDPRSLIGTSADLLDPFRALFVALMDKSCVKCGKEVLVDSAEDLRLFLSEKLSTCKQGLFVTVPLELPEGKKERSSLCQTLLTEGYFRFLVNEKVESLEDIDAQLLPSRSELVLETFSKEVDSEEIANRVETLWSQVRFSPRFQNLKVSDPGSKTAKVFHVQAFCKSCKSHTQVIQSGDLDWQSALGSCSSCHGLGNRPIVDRGKVVPNDSLSIEEDAIKPWGTDTFSWAKEGLKKVMRSLKLKTSTPYSSLPQDFRDFIWNGEWPNGKFSDYVSLNDWFAGLEAERYKPTSRILLAKYRRYVTCESCGGERLGSAGRNASRKGIRFSQLMHQESRHTLAWLHEMQADPSNQVRMEALREIFLEVEKKLSLLVRLGLGNSSISRRCKTLSGGEYQRVLLTRVIGNGLTDALYVLDEPSVGLGQTEIKELSSALVELRDLGNTVLMVEHDPQLIRAADFVVELGPGGGSKGGRVLELKEGEAPVSLQIRVPESTYPKRQILKGHQEFYSTDKSLSLNGFSHLNCKNLDLFVPLGQITVLSGVSGAGKSTLLSCGLAAALERLEAQGEDVDSGNDSPDIDEGIGVWKSLKVPKNLLKTHEVLTVEQRAMHRVISSVPATILGLMDPLRKLFAQTDEAKRNGFGVSDFSFNGAGGCEVCGGRGIVKDDLFFLGEVEKECAECAGTRFRPAVREVLFMGKSIDGWLATPLEDCHASFRTLTALSKPLELCIRLGLGHLPLGVPTTHLSGGEAQRLRMCATLSKSQQKMICLLDEPTRGLSETDVGNLILSLAQLAKEGHTFVIVEHHEEMQKCAHQLVVLGPGGGAEGGQIVRREATSTR